MNSRLARQKSACGGWDASVGARFANRAYFLHVGAVYGDS